MLAEALRPCGLDANLSVRASLSQELYTTALLLLRILIGYCW